MKSSAPSGDEVERPKKRVHEALRRPHRDQPLTRWKLPDTPFEEWDAEYVHVCFYEECPYTVRNWKVMEERSAYRNSSASTRAIGSNGRFPTLAPQWRCGPVTRPVAPTRPMISP